MRSWLCTSLTVAMSMIAPIAAQGQEYPTKQIRLFTAEAGGNADITARLIADHADLGQPIVVMNKPAVVAAQSTAEAAADGYSLLLLGKSFYLSPIFQDTTPYDPVKDFAPVARLTSAPNILVTHPSLPEKVDEIIALAKSKPGELNYATGASGGAGHLAAERFKNLADIDMVRIVYKGGGPSMAGVMGNESQIVFGPPAQVMPGVEAGKLRAVAVTSLKESNVAPGLPPIANYLPGFEMTSTTGIWAPANTPAPVVEKLSKEIERILSLPEVQKQLLTQGADAAFANSADFAKEIDLDIDVTRKLVEKGK